MVKLRADEGSWWQAMSVEMKHSVHLRIFVSPAGSGICCQPPVPELIGCRL
jgi:hypothetical protein